MALKSIGWQVPNLLRDIVETGIVFLYPAKCRVCEAFLEVTSIPYICADCWHDIQFLEPPWCDICGTPGVRGLCNACATAPPRYGKLRSIAFYQTTLQHAIHLFKFQKKQVFAQHLIHLINAHIPIDCFVLRTTTLFFLCLFTENDSGSAASIRQHCSPKGLRKQQACRSSQTRWFGKGIQWRKAAWVWRIASTISSVLLKSRTQKLFGTNAS